MSQSYYSWGGSRVHFIFEDEFAENYNRAQDAWFAAQKEYRETHGKDWTGREPIVMNWKKAEQKAWNDFADLVNLLIKINGGGLSIPMEEMPEDGYLVKL